MELEGAERKVGKKKDNQKLSRQLQEDPRDRHSHDPLSLSRDSEPPRAGLDSDPPSVEPRRSLDPSIIVRRRGSLKLPSKLRS